MLTIGQTKWLALLLAMFFAVTSAGQYVFVRHQTIGTVRERLEEGARELNQAVGFKNRVDLKALNQAVINVGDYFTILGNDAVLDIGSDVTPAI